MTGKTFMKAAIMPGNYIIGLMISGMTFCGVNGFWTKAAISKGLDQNPITRILGYAVGSTAGYLAGKAVEAQMNKNVDKLFDKDEKKD